MDDSFSLLGFSERLGPRHKWLPYALLLSITFALYGMTLYFNFVWDDSYYVNRDFRIQSLSWPYLSSVWSKTYLGHYAPVHNTLLALLYHFFGLEPFGYHAAQLLLHATCVCLVYLLVKKIESPRVALLATLLFAVHPTNIETVAWISETKSTLALLLFLLSLWYFIRLRERGRWIDGIVSGGFLILSVLAKINTVVAPAIFLLYDYKQGTPFRKLRWKSLGCFFFLSAIFTGIHMASFHGSAQNLERSYSGGLLAHWQNIPFLVWFYTRMSLFPHPLSAVQTIRIYNQFDWAVGIAWIGFGASLWLLSRSNRSMQFWGLWFLVFLATVLQIVPNTIWIADRYLYVPLIGGAVLWSELFFWIADRFTDPWRRWSWELATAAVLIAFAWHTNAHLPIWRDNLTLFEATLPTCPTTAYCHASLGLALQANGQPQQGGDELVLAARMEPSPINLMYMADALTLSARNYPEGIRIYQLAIKVAADPKQSVARSLLVALHAKLARAYIRAGNFQAAAQALHAGRSIDPSDLTLRVVDGFLKWREGNLFDARQSIGMVLRDGGGTLPSVDFINLYWGERTEVHRLLSDLGYPVSSARNSGS